MSEATSLLSPKNELLEISKSIRNDFNKIKINVKKLSELQKLNDGFLPENFYGFNLNHEYTKDLDVELDIITNELLLEINNFINLINVIETNQVPAINLYEFKSSKANFTNIFNMTNSALKKAAEISVKYHDINISQILDGLLKNFTPQEVINEYADVFNRKLDIISYLTNEKDMLNRANRLIKNWNNEIELIKEQTIQEYAKKLDDEKELIMKRFEHEAKNLLNRFNNNLRGLEIDVKSALESTNLMTTSVDAGLKTLALLNERTQKLEVEFSSIITERTKFIDEKLNSENDRLNEQLNAIRSVTFTKSNKLKNAQKDFIRLVERAGIYELTQNYDTKAKEEKTEYQTFRKYTSWSIIAAIFSTLAIFIVALIEHAITKQDTSYLLLISRLSISIMFFVLALYLSKQAAKHYECYQENHRTFLQLAALEPFISRMDETEQKAIRKDLIPSYFNQGTEGKFTSQKDEVDVSTNMHSLLSQALNLMAEKKEQKPSNNTSEAN